MFKISLRTVCAATLSLAAIAAAPTASAAIITGSWDPALPPEFGNFGWTATINVKVADNCGVGTPSTPTQPLTMVNLLGVSFGCNGNILQAAAAFEILTAEVGIYDSTNVIRDVLRFNTGDFNASLAALLGLGSQGEILFLGTLDPSNILRSNPLNVTYRNGCQYDFQLALPGPNPEVRYQSVAGEGVDCAGSSDRFTAATAPVTQTRFFVNANGDEGAVIATTKLEIGQRVFGIPTPGSLALALLALGIAGAAASRRARSGHDAA